MSDPKKLKEILFNTKFEAEKQFALLKEEERLRNTIVIDKVGNLAKLPEQALKEIHSRIAVIDAELCGCQIKLNQLKAAYGHEYTSDLDLSS